MGGFTGVHCTLPACPSACSGNGQCAPQGSAMACVCDEGYEGYDCSEKSCPNDCSGNGKCVDGACACNPGWSGYACDIRTCLYDCSQHGFCNNGTCFCQEGYRGRDCSLSSEPQPCQCAIHCVRGCLQQCTKVYETQGAGPSHECYTKCTQKCVPQCVAGKMPVNLAGGTALPTESVNTFKM